MEQDPGYIRIGTTYYKYVERPLSNGGTNICLIPWSIECIKQDHGKGFWPLSHSTTASAFFLPISIMSGR